MHFTLIKHNHRCDQGLFYILNKYLQKVNAYRILKK